MRWPFLLSFLIVCQTGNAQYLIDWPGGGLVCIEKSPPATVKISAATVTQFNFKTKDSLLIKVTGTDVLTGGNDSPAYTPAELAPLYIPALSNNFRTRYYNFQNAVFDSSGRLLQLTPDNKIIRLNGHYVMRFQYHSQRLISYRDSGELAGKPHDYEQYYLLDSLGRLRLVAAFNPLPYLTGDSLKLTALPPDCGEFTLYEYRQNRLVLVKTIDQNLKNQFIITAWQEFEYDKKNRVKKSTYKNYWTVNREQITFTYQYY